MNTRGFLVAWLVTTLIPLVAEAQTPTRAAQNQISRAQAAKRTAAKTAPVNRYVEEEDSEPAPRYAQREETPRSAEPARLNYNGPVAAPLDMDPFAEDQAEARPTPAQRKIPIQHRKARAVAPARADFADDEAPARYASDEEPARLSDENPTTPPLTPRSTGPAEGPGRAGATRLEGPQAAALTIQKLAPPEIQVGKPAAFAIKVNNTGTTAALNVMVEDVVPKGTTLISTTPAAQEDGHGHLVWELGTLAAGGEANLTVEVMPIAEGEVGSVASVHCRTEASARTVCTRPQLAMRLTPPSKVLVGEDVVLRIQLTNCGTGTANNVVLSEKIPQGLKHEAGPELEFEVGALRPNETRDIELKLKAMAPGAIENTLIAKGEGDLQAKIESTIEVVAPALKVSLTGPKRRYLERNATYTIAVSNPGTAPAKEIELVTALPRGMKFVEANNHGHYDQASHSVFWSLEELPAQESGAVSLTAIPVQAGEQKLLIKGKAQRGLSDEHDETISVEGLAAVQFELTDVQDPVEVDGETTYEIKVTNQGSKAASNVRVVAIVPNEMETLGADGPVKHTVEGQRVVFQPLVQLAPKADTTYTVRVKGIQPGDLRFRVQLTTDETRTPINKEESTRVFADE